MARRPKRAGNRNDARANSETQNYSTRNFNTQVNDRQQPIDAPGGGGQAADINRLGEVLTRLREDIVRFGQHVSPLASSGANAITPGTGAGGMGGGAAGPPPAADAGVAGQGGSAAKRFLANGVGTDFGGIASKGIGFVAKAVDKFVGEVGQSIGKSPLEVSAFQAAKEHGLDPGRFTESALGLLSQSKIPGVSGLASLGEGLARKANADADARSGRTARIAARERLAEVAGGLARRGARFTDEQLREGLAVFQEREQRALDVRFQIRGLEDSIGAQRSGLGSGAHVR